MQGADKRELKKSEKTDSPNVVSNIFCDRSTDHVVHSSPSWYDNVLSSGKAGGVRSPLSVIGRSPSGRKLLRADLAAKKAALHGGDLASAKKAVAELMATVEMDDWKENASPRLQQKQRCSRTEALITTERPVPVDRMIQTVGQQITKDVNSVLDTASSAGEATRVEQGLLDKRTDEEDDFETDLENKENLLPGWSTEMSEDVDVEDVGDEVEQLDRQARTLRRQSQLSSDVSEYESILAQLRQVRQRQAELEQLQMTLRSRLLRYRSTPANDEQPLNLKLNSESTDFDQEPLDLRVGPPALKQRQEPNDKRVILADITARVVGNADPDDDCFEVPDSPPSAAATDGVDGVAPLSESVSGELTADETEVEFVEKQKSTACSSPDVNTSPAVVVGVLDQYLASLNVSDISEPEPLSPTATSVASPDTSSEFTNYQTYQRSVDVSGRCFDPIAAVLLDGDDQVCWLHCWFASDCFLLTHHL